MNSWFRRGTTETPAERMPEVPTTTAHLPDAPYARSTVVQFAEKPAELVASAEREWSRAPVKPEPPLVWSSDAPSAPGEFWYAEAGQPLEPGQRCTVVLFGNRLAVVRHSGDAAMYLDVTRFVGRRWAAVEVGHG